jgi:hypothetical protein
MSGARAGADRALARRDSRNVAELARLTESLEQPVRGMRGPAGSLNAMPKRR